MAVKSYSITTERQFFGAGILIGAKLVDPEKKRKLLLEYGFTDLEATFTIIEQELIAEQIKLNPQPVKRGRKKAEEPATVDQTGDLDSDDDLEDDSEDLEDDTDSDESDDE
jgi:hypothetical protein